MSAADIRALFRAQYDEEPEVVAVAPGRINLIGEHTDYNDGFVFPAAIDRLTWIAAVRTEGPSQVFSAESGPGTPFDARTIDRAADDNWAKYPAGMAWALRQAGHDVGNVKAAVTSNIPMGSGVSSSAALEMAFGVIWNEFGGLGIANADLAQLGKVCENQFVGVNSGIMDQMASAMGREGQAMFLDTRSLEIQYAPVPAGLTIVLCDTKKPRALTSSAYNERRSQCEQAAQVIGVAALRDATKADLERAKDQLPEVVLRRARHVITENDRCVRFREALQANDFKALGALMRASHESLRDDYEVSCRELDVMAEAAWGAPGCVGARMTGAGFGGACVALVRQAELQPFKAHLLAEYEAKAGLAGDAMACLAVEGAHAILA